MKRLTLVFLGLALGATAPLAAQKARTTSTGPDADGDGVADSADRCPNTLPNTRVGRDGCPLSLVGAPTAAPARPDSAAAANAAKGRRPPPSLVGAPTAPAGPTAAPPTAPATNPAIVTPQAAQPAPAAPSANTFTAGLSLQPYSGATAAAALEYGRTLGQMLDSTIITLVGVFRNTSGQPLPGATGPDVLSQREKDRWGRCRDLYWDLTTYRTGVQTAAAGWGAAPGVARAAAALDSALASALTDSAATPQCDNLSSMITAPGRWTPWDQQYQSAARHFYTAWYGQILAVHDRDRAFVVALNAALPAARRLAVPPALQRNPPYAGAAVR